MFLWRDAHNWVLFVHINSLTFLLVIFLWHFFINVNADLNILREHMSVWGCVANLNFVTSIYFRVEFLPEILFSFCTTCYFTKLFFYSYHMVKQMMQSLFEYKLMVLENLYKFAQLSNCCWCPVLRLLLFVQFSAMSHNTQLFY